MAGAGDVDGDGRDDPNGSSSGSVRFFSGGTDGCFDVASYCGTSPNSVGPGALITHLGSTSTSAKKFWLQASGLSPHAPGLFLFASQRAQSPFGNGLLCLAPPLGRTPAQTSTLAGLATFKFNPLGPVSGGVISAGTRWNFQLYYRDSGVAAGFNLSDGLTLRFCP